MNSQMVQSYVLNAPIKYLVKRGCEPIIFDLIKKRSEIADRHKAAHTHSNPIWIAIDHAPVLYSYQDDPKDTAPRGKYKQLFEQIELKLIIRDRLRQGAADDQTIAAHIIYVNGWDADDALQADVLKRVRDALQRQQKDGRVVQDFGPDGCLWRIIRDQSI